MRIIEENIDFQVDLIEIKSAKYIGDYAIRIFFNDGINRLARNHQSACAHLFG